MFYSPLLLLLLLLPCFLFFFFFSCRGVWPLSGDFPQESGQEDAAVLMRELSNTVL